MILISFRNHSPYKRHPTKAKNCIVLQLNNMPTTITTKESTKDVLKILKGKDRDSFFKRIENT